MNSICVRCGRTRIVAKKWQETIETRAGSSVIICTLTVCPDPECQRLVEEKQLEQRVKQEEITKAFNERQLQRRQLSLENRNRKAKNLPPKKS